MKRIAAALPLLFLVLSPLLTFVSCETRADAPASCVYEMTVSVDEAENVVSVDQKVTVVNSFGKDIDELIFAFYPDAFTLKTPPPVDMTSPETAYPYGLNAGGYVFLEAGGTEVESVSLCETPCKITVKLSSPLSPGDKTELRFSFNLTLPLCNARYGYNDFSVNLSYFYPQLCRYDENAEAFVFNNYVATGDPFVFDVADYYVTLDCPEDWQIACSAPASGENGSKRCAQGLRDMTLILAPEAEVTSFSSGGYTAYAIHDGSYSYAAEYAANALNVFSQAFCDLPVREYYLVFTPFIAAGAEFSNVALLSSSLTFAETEKTVAHEVSHQWWYSLVGSDQVNFPWQDEALAQWSTLYYFKKRGMKDHAVTILKGYAEFYYDYMTTQHALGESALCDVHRAITDYRDQTDYFATVYCKALLAAEITAQSVTDDGFCNALAIYAKDNRLSFACPDDLYSAFDSYLKGAGNLFRNSLNVSPY